mgnify:CR=1 FL=1
MSIKKKLIIFASIVFGVFLVINILWFAFVWRKYEGYKGKLGNEMVVDDLEELGKRYTLSEGDFGVTIKIPMYPSFTDGFLRIGKQGQICVWGPDGTVYDENGESIDIENTKIKPGMVFYIWPKLFGGYKLGVQYDCFENGNMSMYQLNLNEDLKPADIEEGTDDEYALKLQELYNENYDDMMELIKYANDLFDLELNIN